MSDVTKIPLLPGVSEAYVMDRMAQAGGDEIASGKFAHPESSAALAANAFGWFVERPSVLPIVPGMEVAGTVNRVEIEYSARFPWSQGTHPWLDAVAFTDTYLIGIESKRFEPFRDAKIARFSAAYDRPVWGENMERYSALRDALRDGTASYRHLDAAQLVKHAYGLVTEARRHKLRPHLFYIFAEPTERAGRHISAEDHAQHRAEATDFRERVVGDEIGFTFASYREWLAGASGLAVDHAAELIRTFNL